MSLATYWQRGEALDYQNDGDEAIEAGTVIVLGDKIGIAGEEIAAGELGSVHVTGVFIFTKTGTSEMTIGQTVYFDGDGITDTGDTLAGFVAAAAAADDTTVLVKINA